MGHIELPTRLTQEIDFQILKKHFFQQNRTVEISNQKWLIFMEAVCGL